ncbi:MAG TPA: PAS domain-containing protein [Longimicrobium sp.]|nr:PAS domain-containing protein [Longimicrobium sp.]
MSIDLQGVPVTVDEAVDAVFGDLSDPMPLLDRRARELLAGHDAIVWEADASTFAFGYVSESAETVLGYPVSRWLDEPSFWADVVVHAGDRASCVSFCAAETSRCRDHVFEYRATAVDGRMIRLRDYVRIVTDAHGAPDRLRGVMVAVRSIR